MELEEDEPTDAVAGTGLQRGPAHRHATGIPSSWLDEFAGTPEDVALDDAVRALRRRERLAEDADLVESLRGVSFTGPAYEEFEIELARYGLGIATAWIRQGAIFGKCREKGIGGLPEPPPGALTQPDAAEQLAYETVARALRGFRDTVLIPGRWDPARGASLKTYFIGQCLIRFPNVYRFWLRTEVYPALDERLVDELAVFDRPTSGGPTADPAALAVIRQEVDIVLADAPEATKTMLVLLAAGYTQADVATTLNLSENAVQKATSYWRKRWTKDRPTNAPSSRRTQDLKRAPATRSDRKGA
jgi:DNA-directed RNA polymerase specialized sigma24 family protein